MLLHHERENVKISREEVIAAAGRAGFGANQRNTLLVKLERFAQEMANLGATRAVIGASDQEYGENPGLVRQALMDATPEEIAEFKAYWERLCAEVRP